MRKILGLFLFAVLISSVFSSSLAFALVPTAENDFYIVTEDSILIDPIGVLTNDQNIENGFFSIIQTPVGFGTIVLNPNGNFTYTPNLNFDSVDSFTYSITNGTHNSNNATVTISINTINDLPVARNDTASTLEVIPIIIKVLNNDSDVDSNLLTVNSITQGTNGTVTTNGTTVTYTPKLHFNGIDSFTYTISDGVNISNSAIVTVIVRSFNDEHDDEHDDKINICHKDKKTISVSENAIPAHLKHGDILGRCNHEHDDEHDEITDKKAIKNQIKELKQDFKAKEKALKKDFKAQEKELKNKLKDLKKDKKHDDD